MNLLFTVNDAYVPWLSVLLTSLFANNPGTHFDIYVLCLDLSDANRNILEKQLSAHGATLHVPKIDEAFLPDLHKIARTFGKTHNITFLLRLLFERIMPVSVNQFIYLDTDMIVAGAVNELADYKFDENIGVAVVRDVFRSDDYRRLSFDWSREWYFNAGMMYINLDYWRRYNVGKRCIDYLLAHPNIPMPDQDALNVVLRGHVDYLHPRYNCLTLFCARDEELRKRVLPWHLEQVREAAAAPAIVHYVFVNKPWYRGGKLPYKAEWRKYHVMSPYAATPLRWRDGIKGMLRFWVTSTLGFLGVKRFKSIF